MSKFIQNFSFLSSTELFNLIRLISRNYGFIEHMYNVFYTSLNFSVQGVHDKS